MDYVIRKLNENDYNNYYRLINEFRETYFDEIEFKKILNGMDMNNVTVWIIEKENKIISTVTILYENKFIHNISKIAHIEDVCTLKEFRGKGYGKILLDYVINEVQKEKCYKITLYCKDELEEFYKKTGFEKKGIQMAIYF